MEEITRTLEKAVSMMDKVYEHTLVDFSKIKAGKANPNMLDGVKVDYYGSLVPITQVASINNMDARTLVIKPWDKNALKHIEEGIVKSYLDVVPQNDGEVIHINIPPLTEEKRTQIVKQVKHEAEKGRISMRGVRKDIKESLKRLQKDGASEDLIRDAEDDLQKKTDSFIKKIDDLLANKEKEIMEL
ncbi:MAG: ribosome recycling factor [Bacteroidetes bacterium]|nr:ribosome recycling factor [Bacteroidota bacterium]